MSHPIARPFAGERDLARMADLARDYPTDTLHVVDLPWRLSSTALEDAAIVPGSLRDQPAGVFIGAIGSDYAAVLQRAGGPTRHTLTGTSRGIGEHLARHYLATSWMSASKWSKNGRINPRTSDRLNLPSPSLSPARA